MRRDPFAARGGVKEVRPTTGKTLGALMSILGPLSGARFLDAFSGTGRVAQAAAQRGAEVVTIELLPARAAAVAQLLAPHPHRGLCTDVRRGLRKLEAAGESFDVIFADPPYGAGWERDFPELLARHGALLAPGGTAVLEHSPDEEPLCPAGWTVTDRRRYGGSALTFFQKEEASHV